MLTLKHNNKSFNHPKVLRKTKFLIIGQGLAGTLLATELWKQNADFLVLDNPSPEAASQVAGGAFIPIVFRTLKKAEMIDDYLPALKNTYGFFENLTGSRFFHLVPSLKLFPKDDIPKWQQAKDSAAGTFITDLKESLNLPGIKPEFGGAVIEPSGWVDIKMLTALMGEWFLENNLLIQEKLDYSMIEFEKDGVVINSSIRAEKIIFCEGASAIKNPWFKNAGFSLNKGEIIDIEASGISDEYILRSEVFVLPLGKKTFRVGATYDRNNIDNNPSPAGKQQLLQKLQYFLDTPVSVRSHWAGIRPSVKDRKPLLGAHPEMLRLNIFNGLGSKGVLFAPYWAAKMAAFLLHGEALPDMVNVNRYFKS